MTDLSLLDGLHVDRLGNGPRVVFVHGSMSNGLETFGPQRGLADEFTVELLDRRGFGQSAARTGRVDFDLDADDLLAIAGDGAHLVGHSYGAVVSLVAAARRPSVVRSLTVIEPPAFGVARGIAIVDRVDARMRDVFLTPSDDPAAWLMAFLRGVGYAASSPVSLSESEASDVRSSMTERYPGEALPDLEAIAAAGVPSLVVRGDWLRASGRARDLGGAAFRAIAETVAARLEAPLVTLPGTHNPQGQSAAAFNDLLRGFMLRAQSSGSRAAAVAGAPLGSPGTDGESAPG